MAESTIPQVEADSNHLEVTQEDTWVRVSHVIDEAEAGFDLTDFGNQGNFAGLLEELGISEESYEKVSKSPDDDERDYGVHVWAGEDLAIITGNNPLTGEYSDPEMRAPETGYASYIGLSGTEEAVREARSRIKERAEFIKGENKTDREFI